METLDILTFGGAATLLFFVLPAMLIVGNGIDIFHPPCMQVKGAEFACSSVQWAFIIMMGAGASVIPALLIMDKASKHAKKSLKEEV